MQQGRENTPDGAAPAGSSPRREALYKLIIVFATAGVLWGVYAYATSKRSDTSGPIPAIPSLNADGDATTAEDQIAGSSRRLAPSELPGTTLDEPTVKALLPNIESGGLLRYDSVAVVTHIPGIKKVVPWPEHPDGKIIITTNNMGFREDEDTKVSSSGRRVLVIGDSHTFGFVNQDESFANLLERKLAARGEGKVEVINTGVCGTGPYVYEGSVRKYLRLDPDVVVVVVYAGNDFSEAMAFSDFFSKRRWPPLVPEAKQRIDAARKLERERLVQGLQQAFDFSWRPSNGYTGLAATIERLVSIATMCRAQDVGLLVAILPTKEDADAVADADHVGKIIDLMDLDAEELGVNRRFSLLLAEALRKVGVTVLDLAEPLQAVTDRPLYWKQDHHLNVAGHEVVAGCIEEPVLELLHERERVQQSR